MRTSSRSESRDGDAIGSGCHRSAVVGTFFTPAPPVFSAASSGPAGGSRNGPQCRPPRSRGPSAVGRRRSRRARANPRQPGGALQREATGAAPLSRRGDPGRPGQPAEGLLGGARRLREGRELRSSGRSGRAVRGAAAAARPRKLLRRRRQPRPGSHHHSQGRLRPAFRVAGPRGRARRRAPRARATGGGCGRPGRAGRERFRAVRRHRRAGRRTLRRSAAVGAPRRGAPRRGCVGRLAPADPAAFRRGSARPVGDRAAVRGFESGRGRQLPSRGYDAGAHRPARALSRPPPVLGPGGLLRESGNRSARSRPQARLGLRGAGEHPLRKLARPCPRHADGRRRR